jgi:hypothetical protein
MFKIRLSRSISEQKFLAEWKSQVERAIQPETEFAFDGQLVTARVHTATGKEWSLDNFKTTFSQVLHRPQVAPTCEIKEIVNISSD